MHGYEPIIFDYVKKYNESDYLQVLKESKFGIVLDAHESQGFAIQEALSCNVPLLVWSVVSMTQEEGGNLPDVRATTVPYWDERCGEVFFDRDDLLPMFNKFIENLEIYSPREYIIENLSVDKCFSIFMENIERIGNV